MFSRTSGHGPSARAAGTASRNVARQTLAAVFIGGSATDHGEDDPRSANSRPTRLYRPWPRGMLPADPERKPAMPAKKKPARTKALKPAAPRPATPDAKKLLGDL